jgi:hypothetical protein
MIVDLEYKRFVTYQVKSYYETIYAKTPLFIPTTTVITHPYIFTREKKKMCTTRIKVSNVSTIFARFFSQFPLSHLLSLKLVSLYSEFHSLSNGIEFNTIIKTKIGFGANILMFSENSNVKPSPICP